MSKKRLLCAFLTAVLSATSLIPALAAPTASPVPSATAAASSSPSASASPSATAKPSSSPTGSAKPTASAKAKASASPAPSAKASAAPSASPAAPDASIFMENTNLTPPAVKYAQSALLMDLKSGRIIYSKNADEKLYPASITKILTGIIALEKLPLDEVVTANYAALASITNEDSHMGILIGEELTVEQLISGMLVYSANDAANVLAIRIAGSMDAFAEMMNAKAVELGAQNSHFVNPCGIHDENHYTTAKDMALISQYAMKNEKFREIVKTPIYKMNPTNKYKTERILVNTNLFLGTSRSSYYYYSPAIGIKTGHTSDAQYCLVSAAQYNNTEFLSVVMKCPNKDTKENAYSYIDSKTLLEFGFDNYSYQTIALPGDIISDSKVYEAKNDTRIAITVEKEVSALIPSGIDKAKDITVTTDLPETLTAPIAKGEKLGTVSYSYQGTVVGQANLIATNDVQRDNLLFVLHIITNILTSPFFYVPAIILIFLILLSRHLKKERDRKRRLRQMRLNRQNTLENGTPRRPDQKATRNERRVKQPNPNSRYKGKKEE